MNMQRGALLTNAAMLKPRDRWSLGFVQTLALVSLGSALRLGAAELKAAAAPELPLRRAPC